MSHVLAQRTFCCTLTRTRGEESGSEQGGVTLTGKSYLLLVVLHVLFVALLHHLPLPPLLLQSLLDELSHFALLARLLPADDEPGG